MMYQIVGPHRVCGFEPGANVDEDDLSGADVAHLIAAGHIAPSKKLPKAKPEDSANDGEEQQ